MRDYLKAGPLGFPVVDVAVALTDGSFHSVDSSDAAFQTAGRLAMSEGMPGCAPVLLEPVMRVEVDTPGEEQGDLLGDLTRRRGNILAVEAGQNSVLLNAQVPLAEMWGYANAIRSLSRGRASYSMSPSHFERVPAGLAMKIATASGSD